MSIETFFNIESFIIGIAVNKALTGSRGIIGTIGRIMCMAYVYSFMIGGKKVELDMLNISSVYCGMISDGVIDTLCSLRKG